MSILEQAQKTVARNAEIAYRYIEVTKINMKFSSVKIADTDFRCIVAWK